MDWSQHVVSNPEVLFRKPAISGTRLAVEFLLDRLTEGTALEELLEMYPSLNREHIYAALAFAAHAIRHEWRHKLS